MADPFLQYQMDEAAKAEAKEKKRQQDLADGRARINAIFDGGTITAPSTFTTQKVGTTVAPQYTYSTNPVVVPYSTPAPAPAAAGQPAAKALPYSAYQAPATTPKLSPSEQDRANRLALSQGKPMPYPPTNGLAPASTLSPAEKDRANRLAASQGKPPPYQPDTGRPPASSLSPSEIDRANRNAVAAGNPAPYGLTGNGGEQGQRSLVPGTGVTTYEDVTTEVPGASTTYGGIGQAFYDGFRKTLNDFYQPEVERQYGKAKQENLYDLARRGTLRSSDAVTKSADLTTDYAGANAKVKSDIEGQVTGLQTDVNNSKLKALNLLTSTEDPTTAANLASSELNAIQSKQPTFNDLGDLFARAIGSYATYNDARTGRAAVNSVPQRSPYQSSGKVI